MASSSRLETYFPDLSALVDDIADGGANEAGRARLMNSLSSAPLALQYSVYLQVEMLMATKFIAPLSEHDILGLKCVFRPARLFSQTRSPPCTPPLPIH